MGRVHPSVRETAILSDRYLGKNHGVNMTMFLTATIGVTDIRSNLSGALL